MPDSTTNDDRYMITRVKALYPRINQTYKFDSSAGKKGQSVPCDALDDGAKYELSFLLDESAAKELYAPMAKAYLASPKRDKTWHETLPLPFKKEVDEDGEETGNFIGKTTLRGNYDGELTTKPAEFDSKRNKLPADFRLTTGSTVNIAVKIVPYAINGSGVSLRLLAVQVLDYIPYAPPSPFGEEEGFSYDASAENTAAETNITDIFAVAEPVPPAAAPVNETPKNDPFEEPVKRPSKQAAEAPPSKAKLASVIDKWADDKGK